MVWYTKQCECVGVHGGMGDEMVYEGRLSLIKV